MSDDNSEIDSDFNNSNHTTEASTTNSLTGRSSKRLKSRSWTWQHFKVRTGGDVECRHCGSGFSSKTSTASLAVHLSKKHNIVQENRDKRSQTTISNDGTIEIHGKLSDKKRDNITSALVQWIVDSKQSFSVVESPALARLFHILNSGYALPSRRTIGRCLEDQYDSTLSKMKLLLEKIPCKISLTIDAWSSRVYRGYLAVTVHWITNEWTLKSSLLDFSYFPPPHNTQTTSDLLFNILTDMNLGTKILGITTDSGAEMPKAIAVLREKLNNKNPGKILKDWHVRCICHIINRSVQDAEVLIKPEADKIRELLKSIRYSSTLRKAFHTTQVQLGCEPVRNVPALDCQKDWNSLYRMLKTCYELRSVFEAICNHHAYKKFTERSKLTNLEWQSIRSVSDFLRLAKVLTIEASSSSYVTISLQPVIVRFSRVLEKNIFLALLM